MSTSNIPNCIPAASGREAEYVNDVVASGLWAVGPYIERFEAAMAAAENQQHAVAVSSGTAALHLALLSVGVSPNDLVVMPATTFAATANAALMCGAGPVLLDVTEDTLCLDPAALEKWLAEETLVDHGECRQRSTGRRVGAVVPVHVYGFPADRDAINALSARYGIPVVEDGAESLGTRFRGAPLGENADVYVLSFNGNKIITSGGGGMVLTRDPDVAKRVRYLANQAKAPGIDFIHDEPGYNYRISNLHAALGLAQAECLAEHLEAKRRIAEAYASAVSGIDGLSIMLEGVDVVANYWMPILQVDPDRFSHDAHDLIDRLVGDGIGARPVWAPLSRNKAYAHCIVGDALPVASSAYRSRLCLPCSVSITDQEISRVSDAVAAWAQEH